MNYQRRFLCRKVDPLSQMEIKVLLNHWPIKKSSLVLVVHTKLFLYFINPCGPIYIIIYIYIYIILYPLPTFLSAPFQFTLHGDLSYMHRHYLLFFYTVVTLFHVLYPFVEVCSLRLCAFSFVDYCSVFWCKDECFGSFIIIIIIIIIVGGCRLGKTDGLGQIRIGSIESGQVDPYFSNFSFFFWNRCNLSIVYKFLNYN